MEDSGGPSVTVSSNGFVQPISYEENDLRGDDIFGYMDSHLEDINERLIVSQMVSDCVIKEMFKAVSEEATERIAQKELEVVLLKERLHFYESRASEVEELGFQRIFVEEGRQKPEGECFGSLTVASDKQFHKLEKEIEDIKMCRLFPGQSKMEESEKWVEVDQTLNTLKNMVSVTCKKVDNMDCLSKASLCEWQKEREFQEEVEAMVIRNFIRGLQEEFELQLSEQSTQFCGSQSTNQLEKVNQLSSLHQELNFISRTLSSPEMGLIPLNGTLEGSEECNNDKRKDYLHCKVFNNRISRAQSLGSANGTKEFGAAIPGAVDYAHLKNMSSDELITYFKNEVTKMKREHETLAQEMTEEYFSIRREFLKERGPLSSLKKDKDFEAFRKKIPEVIGKLDKILIKSERLPVVYENNEIIASLRERVDSLVAENHKIKDLLTDKNKEVKCLTSKVSTAAEEMSHHSLAEINLLKQIRKLKSDIKDMKIESAIREDVCGCIVKELIGETKCAIQDSNMEATAVLEIYEIIFKEIAVDAKATTKCDVEDSDIVSVIMQDTSAIVFREAVKDAVDTMNCVRMKYEEDNEQMVSLKVSLLESNRKLSLETEEKEQLQKEIIRLSALVEEKEKLVLEKGSLLMEEEVRYNLITNELNLLKDKLSQKDILVSESTKETHTIRSKLEDALRQTQLYKEEITKLEGANEENERLYRIIQEKETALSLVEEREKEHKKHVESITAAAQSLFKTVADFEGQTAEAVEKNNSRLKKLKFQLDRLVKEASMFKGMQLVYSQRLERRDSDLQKAEAEVDLLGDEVEALLSLLEKIYIALYHYSPVLQHYTGIMEILKLVKRELSVETSYDRKQPLSS